MRTHAVIAGTGRAGTTFLIEYLSNCGVNAGDLAHLARFDDAAAGLEVNLLSPTAPYLVKDPWLFEYCEDLSERGIRIEALIIPVRDLADAAFSRVLQERIRLTAQYPYPSPRTVDGGAPGGVLYSISVAEQERVLAMAQARLLSWAVREEVPVFFLDFPRLINDFDYLYRTLEPWLCRFTSREHAEEQHRRLADPNKIRVSKVENATVLSLADLLAERDAINVNLVRSRSMVDAVTAELAGVVADRDRVVAELAGVVADRDRVVAELAAVADALATSVRQRAKMKARVEETRRQLEIILTSESFRFGRALTTPIRISKAFVTRKDNS